MHTLFLYLMGIVAVGYLTVTKAESVPFVDGPSELSGLELTSAKEYLDGMLVKLADGADSSYISGKVTSVTRQVISGVLYYYNVELVTEMVTKQCIIVIKDQTWIQDGATEIRINCEGDDTEIEATF